MMRIFVASFRMDDNKQFPTVRSADSDKTVFHCRMNKVWDGQRTWISENRRSFFETSSMLSQIRFRLVRIPFKIEGHDGIFWLVASVRGFANRAGPKIDVLLNSQSLLGAASGELIS